MSGRPHKRPQLGPADPHKSTVASDSTASPISSRTFHFTPIMVYGSAALLVGLAAIQLGPGQSTLAHAAEVPTQAQVISPKSFAVLDTVLPPDQANVSTVSPKHPCTADLQPFAWPGTSVEELKAKPFHIYDDEFYAIIGDNPTLTLVAATDGDPLFHEATAWYVGATCLYVI